MSSLVRCIVPLISSKNTFESNGMKSHFDQYALAAKVKMCQAYWGFLCSGTAPSNQRHFN